MALTVKQNADYDRQADRCRDSETPCVICGRPVKDPWPHAIRLGQGGFIAVTVKEDAQDPAGSMGAAPVGSECWRKHPELHPYGE